MPTVSAGSTPSSSQSTCCCWPRSAAEGLTSRVKGVRCSVSSAGRSWNAKRGINPGEEGGIDPSTFFFWRRRLTVQKAKRMAAAPTRPIGMPTPRPIFWLLVKPSLVAAGDSKTGVDEAEDVVDAVGEADKRDVEVEASSLGGVEEGRREDSNVVGLADAVETDWRVLEPPVTLRVPDDRI